MHGDFNMSRFFKKGEGQTDPLRKLFFFFFSEEKSIENFP